MLPHMKLAILFAVLTTTCQISGKAYIVES
jgi:hypothetical protein